MSAKNISSRRPALASGTRKPFERYTLDARRFRRGDHRRPVFRRDAAAVPHLPCGLIPAAYGLGKSSDGIEAVDELDDGGWR